MHPRDLLILARTTKDFRALLMSRSSGLFWATSRKQIEGLPEIPDNFSEPAYANLLFCNHCHTCQKAGINVSVYWDIPARYCSRCRDSMFTTSDDDTELKDMVEGCGLTYANDVVMPVYLKSLDAYVYHTLELEEVKSKWLGLKTKEDRAEYVQERQLCVLRRKENTFKLKAWEDFAKQNALAEEAALVTERRAGVWTKLRDEGWGEELDKMSPEARQDLINMNVVSRPSKLTNRSWGLARGTIVEFLEKIRSARLDADQRAFFSTRFDLLEQVLDDYQHKKWRANRQGHVFMSLAECAMFKTIRLVIEDTSEELTEDLVKAKLMDIVPTIVTRWVDKRRAEFTTLLLTKLGQDSTAAHTPDPLDLAIAWFNCTCNREGCSIEQAQWPLILDHSHFRAGYHPREDNRDPYLRNLRLYAFPPGMASLYNTRARVYEGQSLCVDRRLAHIRDVIATCGADPETATFAQMEETNSRLVCRVCATLLRREVFDWKAAIAHDFVKHYSDMSSTSKPLVGRWERIPDEYAANAKALEAVILAETPDRISVARLCTFHCSWCACHNKDFDMMKIHIQASHLVNSPQLDRDFYVLRRARTSIWMFADVLSECSAEKADVKAGTAFFANL